MPLGQRQLFIYWRVSHADLPAALAALREWHAGLIAQHPGLRCTLYRRTDGATADATVMESYAIDMPLPHAGIDEALQRHIDQCGRALLARWLRGTRHVEVFDALPA
jgi:hypothetical protein